MPLPHQYHFNVEDPNYASLSVSLTIREKEKNDKRKRKKKLLSLPRTNP